MVGGQVMDLANDGKALGAEELDAINDHKTGALFRASTLMGSILAGADEGQRQAATDYAVHIGRAFQITDDLLDITADPAKLGKPVGSDAAQGKVTDPTRVGLEKSRELGEKAGAEALAELEGFDGEAAEFLRLLVEYVLKRAS